MDFWLQNGKGHVASWGVTAGVHDVHVLRRQSLVAQVGLARIPALSVNMTTQCRHCSWRERPVCATKACGCLGCQMHLPTRAADKPSTTMFSFSPCSKALQCVMLTNMPWASRELYTIRVQFLGPVVANLLSALLRSAGANGSGVLSRKDLWLATRGRLDRS